MQDSKSNGKLSMVWPRGEFEYFNRLPPELRVRIWRFALIAPRVIKFHGGHKAWKTTRWTLGQQYLLFTRPPEMLFRQETKIPPLLHVCKESRCEALFFGGFKTWKSDVDFPIHMLRPRDMIERWSKFRPEMDSAFIMGYDTPGFSPHEYSERVEIVHCESFKRVILPKSVAQQMLKYEKDEETLYHMSEVLRAFPRMKELTISFNESSDVFGTNDYKMMGKVTRWLRIAAGCTRKSTIQGPKFPFHEQNRRQLTVNISPSVWEYLHLFL